MGKMKKKYTSGTAKAYITRNKALRLLQLSLADFRRLCILKGVYPVEPRSLKKASKGAPKLRTFFHRSDIRFLLHEPIINTFRALKIYSKRLNKYRNKRDQFQSDRIERSGKPELTLDHIILERYPKFTDAIADLDDCLCLLILYATYPIDDKLIEPETILACRRLIVEFMNYVMTTKSLRKCFISIKGFYVQANVQGQPVTWIMPHQVGYSKPFEIDLKIMNTFLEFYVQMLGFVNFKLYSDARLVYPPSFGFTANKALENLISQQEFFEEMLSSFNMEVRRRSDDSEQIAQEFEIPSADLDSLGPLQRVYYERLDSPQAISSLTNLFEKCVIFVGREVPLEVFAFAIRSCGGKVSWAGDAHCGSTFSAEDPSVTHQLIDRPIAFADRLIGRSYVQPQWIFDCINFRRLLPVESYAPDRQPPAHFSPFVAEKHGEYVSPDKLRLLGLDEDEIDRLVKANEPNEDDDLKGMSVEERKFREAMMPKKLKRIYKKAVHAEKKERNKAKNMKAKPNMEKKRRKKAKNRKAKLAARAKN